MKFIKLVFLIILPTILVKAQIVRSEIIGVWHTENKNMYYQFEENGNASFSMLIGFGDSVWIANRGSWELNKDSIEIKYQLDGNQFSKIGRGQEIINIRKNKDESFSLFCFGFMPLVKQKRSFKINKVTKP